MDISMLALSSLVETGEDADALTKHTDRDLRRLVDALQEFGVMEPVVYNRRTKQVVKGKGKVEAALSAGWTEVPALVVDVSEEDQPLLELALRAPFGRRDRKAVTERMVELFQAGAEVERTHWPIKDIERMTGQVPPPEPRSKQICCPNCGNHFEA